jgi:drug/metabolite transporter (DMT)-like permease
MNAPVAAGSVSRLGVVSAFAAIFLVWGSVYVAVKFAVETLPPFLMVGVRMAFAGLALYIWARARGGERPTAAHWRAAATIGVLVIFFGSGAVAWAQKRGVPSGLTALLVATEPFWMILVDWLRHAGRRPNTKAIFGMVLGFAGVGLLVAPGRMGGSVDPIGAATILFGSVCWAFGSLYSRSAPQPRSLLLAIAMQMFAGGVALLVAGSVAGEWAQVNLGQVSRASWIAFWYLLIFATLITFPAYIWLLRVVSAARVSMYAYVNPVVALLLGWLLAGEGISTRALAAAAMIVASVVMVITCGEALPNEPATET